MGRAKRNRGYYSRGATKNKHKGIRACCKYFLIEASFSFSIMYIYYTSNSCNSNCPRPFYQSNFYFKTSLKSLWRVLLDKRGKSSSGSNQTVLCIVSIVYSMMWCTSRMNSQTHGLIDLTHLIYVNTTGWVYLLLKADEDDKNNRALFKERK